MSLVELLKQKLKQLPFYLEPDKPVMKAEKIVRLADVLAEVGVFEQQLKQLHIQNPSLNPYIRGWNDAIKEILKSVGVVSEQKEESPKP